MIRKTVYKKIKCIFKKQNQIGKTICVCGYNISTTIKKISLVDYSLHYAHF